VQELESLAVNACVSDTYLEMGAERGRVRRHHLHEYYGCRRRVTAAAKGRIAGGKR